MKIPSNTPFYAPSGHISITPEWWDGGWRIRDVPYNPDVLILTPPTNYQMGRPEFEIFVFHGTLPSNEVFGSAILHSTTKGMSGHTEYMINVVDYLTAEISVMNLVVSEIVDLY